MIPIHPKVVHFPLALLISALLFAILAISIKNKGAIFKEVFKWNLFLGTIASFAALFSGLLAERNLVHNETIHDLMKVHENLGFIVTSVFTALSLWLIIKKSGMKTIEMRLFIFILATAVLTMIYSAHLGGRMVYEQGAGVIPMKEIINNQMHEHDNDDGHSSHEHHSDSHNH